jgi:hypothetical protein
MKNNLVHIDKSMITLSQMGAMDGDFGLAEAEP